MKTHRPLGNILRTLLVCLLLQGSVASVKAQSQQGDYFVENGIAFYHGEPFGNVDLPTFIELGFGYAKDRYNVYFRGEIMEFVDPLTFRLKVPQWAHPDYDDSYYDRGDYRRSGYMVTSNAVLFRGRIVEKANPDSFKELGGGYARDTFRAYYMGRIMENANPDALHYLGEGYAANTFRVYYMGKIVEQANPDSFKLLQNGYAEDTFRTYYRGKKVN